MRKYQQSRFILHISDGVWGLFLIHTILKNRDPPPLFSKFPNWDWDISVFFLHCPKFSRFSILTPPLSYLIFTFLTLKLLTCKDFWWVSRLPSQLSDYHMRDTYTSIFILNHLYHMVALGQNKINLLHLKDGEGVGGI